jgi:serine/threonine-protein kinase
VKVADFGVAKAQRTNLMIERPAETRSNIIVGSPAYASPEQLFGGDVDVRTDLWSLGVLAYEALTGRRPFMPSSDEVSLATLIVNITMKPFKPPSRLVAGFPSTLDAWFIRALAKDPKQRFQTISEMRTELAKALAPQERRRALIRGAIAAACVASPLVVAAVFFATKNREPPPSSEPAIQLTAKAPPVIAQTVTVDLGAGPAPTASDSSEAYTVDDLPDKKAAPQVASPAGHRGHATASPTSGPSPRAPKNEPNKDDTF